MNSNNMSNWGILFLLFAVVGISIELFIGKGTESTWYFIILSTMFNIGSSIMKKLEYINKHLTNKG